MTKVEKAPDSAPRPSENRSRLGRGLAALLADSKADTQAADNRTGAKSVPIEFVRTNPRNPRRHFSEVELEDLTASIRERGIIQPIVVRPVEGANDTYEIIAGERRWRAAQRAGLHVVPIVVLQISDREALELSIIENVQREDLNAIEEAKGYSQLAAEYGYSHADIGRIIGKSRSYVANTLRLLVLPEHSQELLSSGAISAGHARALLALENPDQVADRIVARGLTVRDVEKLSSTETPPVSTTKIRATDPNIDELAKKFSAKLGIDVSIKLSRKAHLVQIKCINIEQLDYLFEALAERSDKGSFSKQ